MEYVTKLVVNELNRETPPIWIKLKLLYVLEQQPVLKYREQ